MKQKLILTTGTARVKTGFLTSKEVRGFVVLKATNMPAQEFYTKENLDELTDMGIEYEIKYKHKIWRWRRWFCEDREIIKPILTCGVELPQVNKGDIMKNINWDEEWEELTQELIRQGLILLITNWMVSASGNMSLTIRQLEATVTIL